MEQNNMEKEPIRIAHVIGKWVGGGVESVVMNYYRNIDKGWHLYYIDVASLQGEATIVFNGGYIDKSSTDSQYVFSNILLY